MKIHRTSFFKDPENDLAYFDQWVKKLENVNNRSYHRIDVRSSLGNTVVWGLNTELKDCETLVIFPGARTTPLIWDLDRGLDQLKTPLKIFMIETNGLPNPSDGNTPNIKSLEYGYWANEVLESLGITSCFIAGASFGGLICAKLGIAFPHKVKASFLLNPGCLQNFSMTFKNLYYNLLPIVKTNEENVALFLDKAVFSKPNHRITPTAQHLLIDYEVFAISRYKDNTQKPYYMGKELKNVEAVVYVLLGEKDLLFPYLKSKENAEKHLKHLKQIELFENVGHGIETYSPAIHFIGKTIWDLTSK
jgi:esterase/lipase